MKRVNVIGTTSSGKSTLSRRLAKLLDGKYIEMDALYWQSDWQPVDDRVLFERIRQTIDCDCWVLDGNYTRSRTITWPLVDTVIWLDYSFLHTLKQCLSRALSRAWSGEELWQGTGNRESLDRLFSKDSIVVWLFKTYRKNRKRNLALLQNPMHSHIHFVHIRTPTQLEKFIADL